MTFDLGPIAKAIHDYDRRDSLGQIPSWSKLKKADKDRYFGLAEAALDAVCDWSDS